jgi:NAD(P)-dependent dehydrogenase (short-subunit alcohol dehydrogenase family)
VKRVAELDAKAGLVTGGAAGIGRAIAKRAAAEGSFVLVCDIDEEGGRSCVEEILQDGGRAHFTRTDISIESEVIEMLAAARDLGGALHWACNNAMGGSGAFGPLAEVTAEAWNSGVGVTLTGTFFCVKHEIRSMLETGGGSIVNISSPSGLRGETFLAAYSAAKGGVEALTKTAAAEYATRGIRVNSICPGGIETEAIARYFEHFPDIKQKTIATHAMRRLGRPEEIADAVVYLACDRASFITGHALHVDGGISVNSHMI